MGMTEQAFAVSVIIPVYNAARFIARAVEQVLIQPEVTELILMEDGSPDGSLDICKSLESEHSIIRVFQHEGGVNLGAAATRNAGVKHTTNEFVAFADADNFYLPGRFKLDGDLFASDPSIDGIYHAQGIHYEDDKAKEMFFAAGLGEGAFLSISEPVPPQELLMTMLGRHPTAKILGGLGIDAITLRRRCFDKAGYFPVELKLQQDVYFFMKLAASCRMQAGNIAAPVALRGVHGDMRSTDSKLLAEYGRLRWRLLDKWFAENVTDANLRRMYRFAYADYKIQNSNKYLAFWELLKSMVADPKTLFIPWGRFDMNFKSVFGKSMLAKKALSAKNRLVQYCKR